MHSIIGALAYLTSWFDDNIFVLWTWYTQDSYAFEYFIEKAQYK